jgi:hypothetical protein
VIGNLMTERSKHHQQMLLQLEPGMVGTDRKTHRAECRSRSTPGAHRRQEMV